MTAIMSGRKGSTSKITLGMIKGKSIATSVPSFAIRFNAGDEELEDIYPSAEETDEEGEKQDEELSSASSTPVAGPLNELSTVTTTAVPSRDPSPMKEYLKGLGKRSTSMDAGIIEGTATSEPWRIFHELRGKITKTVEEKFSEIKSDRKVFSGASDSNRTSRLSGGKSKDNSSVSDSEDISEASNKGALESKLGVLKVEESSPKRVSGDKELKKQSLSLEEKEKEDLFKDLASDLPSAASAVDITECAEISHILNKKSDFRTKMKSNLSGLRHRHRSGISKVGLTGSVTMSSLCDSQDNEGLCDCEVESGVEVSEETFLLSGQPDTSIIDPSVPTTDYRTEVPTSHPIYDARGHRIRQARSLMSRIWSYKYFFLILICVFIQSFISVPPFVFGFLCGSVCIILIYTIRDFIKRLVTPNCEFSGTLGRTTNFNIPDYSPVPILEVPPVKEYQPLTKYEGWMNEYQDTYEPETYTINETQSVYVRLEGSTLRISHTRVKIPKRAMWNERKHRLRFSHQRIYTITNCVVKLLPEGLNRKRLWSKKYPICIVLHKFSKYGIHYLKEDNLDDEHDPSSETSQFESNDVEADSRSDYSESISSIYPSGEPKSGKSDVDSDFLKVKQDVGESKFLLDDEEPNTQEDLSDEDTFCHIDKTSLEETCLYLFARTDREKEDWYRRFVAAVKYNGTDPMETSTSQPLSKTSLLETSSDTQQDAGEGEDTFSAAAEWDDGETDYLKFMSRFQAQNARENGQSQEKLDEQSQSSVEQEVSYDVMWINALVGRVLFDILRNPEWVLKIQERIQKKLSAIKLPYFMEELLVTELEMGKTVPLVHRATKPVIDDRGLWVDLDVSYEGMVCLTLETKLNLMKLKRVAKEGHSTTEKRGSPMFDSDIDDTAESSDDESELNKTSSEEDVPATSASAAGSSSNTGKKILRMVNKIAASKYFQHATEYKYIKRAMEEVSNTRIILSVELKGLVGTLAVNIPPHPSDRLWYGFRGNPRLWLSARPKFGERRVNIGNVISWIEKKLIQEFQKKFVLPNMDDLVIPPMTTQLPV